MKYLNTFTCLFAVFMFSFSYGQTAQEWLDEGLEKYSLGQYEDAIQYYDRAIQIKPDFADAYLDRGMAKRKLGKYKEAINDYDEVIRLNPNYTAYLNKGVAYHYLKQYSDAIHACDTAITINSRSPKAYYNRAVAYHAMGEFDEAVKGYREVILKDSNYRNVRKSLKQAEELMAPPNIWAMAVGINQYQYKTLSNLETAVDHAYEFRSVLKNSQFVNSEVPVLTNSRADKEAILQKMEDIFDSEDVKPNDMIIFYFSGHGVAFGNDDEGFGICPYEYFKGQPLIRDEEILNVIRNSRAKHKICFIESCKSKVETAGIIPQEMRERFDRKRSKIDGGIVFITSAKVGEPSYEYTNTNVGGVFSHYLIEGMKGKADTNQDSIITAKELFSYIRQNVFEYSEKQQEPQINEDYIEDTPIFIFDNKN